eukprot:984567_1
MNSGNSEDDSNGNHKHLCKSRSVASLMTLPATKKWSAIHHKFRETQFEHVLKLQKLVHHRSKKRLTKSSTTTNIALNKTNQSSLSWKQHLELLQEYDYNRVILQELCSNIGLSNKHSGRLLSTLIERNNQIINHV